MGAFPKAFGDPDIDLQAMGLKDLESMQGDVHGLQIEVTALLKKFEASLEQDDGERAKIREAHMDLFGNLTNRTP